MMDAPTFGAFLAETRRARGLTQRDLAERLHVTDNRSPGPMCAGRSFG